MLRLVLLLCAGVFAALLLAGEDRGQLRPGLAAARADGRDVVVLTRQMSAPVTLSDRAVIDKTAAPVLPPVKAIAAAFTPAKPAPVPETRMPAPVFTLSSLPGIGSDQASLPAAEPAVAGNLWRVDVTAVNVRSGPSPDTAVVEQLARGETLAIVGPTDGDWVEIRIEGDGVTGFVARRFLAPAEN